MKTKILFFVFVLFQLSQSFATVPTVGSKKDSAAAYVSKDDEAMVKNAVAAFKSLSKKERKSRLFEAKAWMKNYKAQKSSADESSNTVLLAILAILLPPLAVYLHENDTNTRFWISLLLTLLFWLPGVIYALIVVLS